MHNVLFERILFDRIQSPLYNVMFDRILFDRIQSPHSNGLSNGLMNGLDQKTVRFILLYFLSYSSQLSLKPASITLFPPFLTWSVGSNRSRDSRNMHSVIHAMSHITFGRYRQILIFAIFGVQVSSCLKDNDKVYSGLPTERVLATMYTRVRESGLSAES
jgi:hypothetical protein